MEPRRTVSMKVPEEKIALLASKGVLILDEEIDESSSFSFCLDILNYGLSGILKDRPLLVVLNTPGGQVDQGFAIYDAIRMLVASGTEVHVFGLGLVASMGTVIMQAGSRRISSPHTQFLVHQASQSIGFFGNEEVSKLRERSDELDRLNDIVMNIIAERSGIGLDELKKLCKKTDYWLDPKGARALGSNGLVDEIAIIPDILKGLFESAQAVQ